MKFRQEGQGAEAELIKQTKEDMRMALEAKERKHVAKTKGIDFEEERKKDLLLLEQAPMNAADAVRLVPKAIDADDEEEEEPVESDDDDEVIRDYSQSWALNFLLP